MPATSVQPDYALLSTAVRLHDIDNAEAFVRHAMRIAKVRPTDESERDEIVAEGLAILCDLATKFVPHKPGYEKPGSFAGYAIKYLPRKIFTAWHKLHPQHVLRTLADGTKRYEYGQAPRSLDAMMEDNDGHSNVDFNARNVGDFAGK